MKVLESFVKGAGGPQTTLPVMFMQDFNTFLVIFTVQWRQPESLIHIKTMEQWGSVGICVSWTIVFQYITAWALALNMGSQITVEVCESYSHALLVFNP